MPERTALLTFMRELDFKHDGKWQDLPDDHPDIVKLRLLEEAIPKRGPKIKYKKPEIKYIKPKEKTKSDRQRMWTKEEDEFLLKHAESMTIKEMAKELKRSHNSVAYRCARNEIQPKRAATSNSRAVVQMDMERKRVAVYPSIRIAAEETGIYFRGISKVANGHRESAGGYYWEFEEER